MSSIYIQEPPTEGKILLTTTGGEFDIELWSKEAPKAARNFVQLCLEGYYNGTIFHRVVPGFIVQGGDPTGTGQGGESIYGKPFRDEFHSRLRFVRRGLVAMANAGPHDNASQFFFTLGACPELQNKHTIFGKLAGKTQYNLSRFEEGEITENDRPAFPYKIIKTEVLSNPFPDIEPRMEIENEIPKEERKKRKKGTKNFKLLSFGDEAEEEEEEVMAMTKSLGSKGTSAHDIAHDPTLSAKTANADETSVIDRIKKKLKSDPTNTSKDSQEEILDIDLPNENSNKHNTKDISDEPLSNKSPDILKENLDKQITKEVPDKLLSKETSPSLPSTKPDQTENNLDKLANLKAENKKLMRELAGKEPKSKKESSTEVVKPSVESDVVKKYYEERAVYEDIRLKQFKKGKDRESQTLACLERFTNKLHSFLDQSDDENDKPEENDDENGDGWLRQKLIFKDESMPVLAKDASTKNDSWYDVTDPRNAIVKRRRDEGSTSRRKSKT